MVITITSHLHICYQGTVNVLSSHPRWMFRKNLMEFSLDCSPTYTYYYSGCTLESHGHMSFPECSVVTWPCHVTWLTKSLSCLCLYSIVCLEILVWVFRCVGNLFLLEVLITIYSWALGLRGLCSQLETAGGDTVPNPGIVFETWPYNWVILLVTAFLVKTLCCTPLWVVHAEEWQLLLEDYLE